MSDKNDLASRLPSLITYRVFLALYCSYFSLSSTLFLEIYGDLETNPLRAVSVSLLAVLLDCLRTKGFLAATNLTINLETEKAATFRYEDISNLIGIFAIAAFGLAMASIALSTVFGERLTEVLPALTVVSLWLIPLDIFEQQQLEAVQLRLPLLAVICVFLFFVCLPILTETYSRKVEGHYSRAKITLSDLSVRQRNIVPRLLIAFFMLFVLTNYFFHSYPASLSESRFAGLRSNAEDQIFFVASLLFVGIAAIRFFTTIMLIELRAAIALRSNNIQSSKG